LLTVTTGIFLLMQWHLWLLSHLAVSLKVNNCFFVTDQTPCQNTWSYPFSMTTYLRSPIFINHKVYPNYQGMVVVLSWEMFFVFFVLCFESKSPRYVLIIFWPKIFQK
jgi:hypothetical protein